MNIEAKHENGKTVTPHLHQKSGVAYYALSARPESSNKSEHYIKVTDLESVANGLAAGLHLRMSYSGGNANLRAPVSIQIDGKPALDYLP